MPRPADGASSWLTPWPSFCEGLGAHRRLFCLYGSVVNALPDSDPRKRGFACPCCPSSPCISLYCWVIVGMPIPHVQTLICGVWVVAAKLRRLRSLFAPEEPRVSLCDTAADMDRSLLQMHREVKARTAAGLPIIALPAVVQIDR